MDDTAAGRAPVPARTHGPPLPQPGRPAPAVRADGHRAAEQLTADTARTAAARRLQTATARPDLDGLATVAARLLGVASGRISLLADGPLVVGAHGPQPAPARDRPGEELARTVCSQTAAAGRPLVIPDTHVDLRVTELPAVRAGEVGSYLGVPLATRDGCVVGAFCVFDPGARDWAPGDASLLQHLAGAAAAGLELAVAGEVSPEVSLVQTAVRSAGVGTRDLEVATGRVDGDEQAPALFGLRREELDHEVDVALDRIHPGDRAAARTDVAVALATGSVLDVTAHRRAAERIAGALDGVAVGCVVTDGSRRVVHANAAAERLTGTARADLLGRSVVDLFSDGDGGGDGDGGAAALTDLVRRALHAGEAVTEVTAPGTGRRVEVRVVPGGEGLAVYLVDGTDRHEPARAAERASTRASLLAEVTAVATGTDDPDVAAQRLAELLVPALGDWCVVTLVEDDRAVDTPVRTVPHPFDLRRGLRDVGSRHRDPARVPLLARYVEHRLSDLTEHAPLWRALREGRPLQVPDATAAVSAVLDPDGVARAVLAELAPSSGLVLPLPGRGRTVGLLTLFQDADRPPLDAEDVATVVELAGRAGLALDSARLHRHQRRFAEELQRSLLTDPPAPARTDLVVRYVPSTRTAQVGGDWYDAFEQPAGTVLVIGDVVGHDTRAATAMAQVRTVVRTLGAVGDDRPADVLTRTDRVLVASQPDVTASVLVARLEEGPGGATRLRWSCAGHPPAAVLTPAGAVEFLTAPDADLLLGVDPAAARHDHVADLPAGSTVLLYTDGLVERRGTSLDEGFAALAGALAETAAEGPTDLDALVDGLLARTLPAGSADDVAVLALRLHGRG
ncbi:SpoIIE family protein phosphatase [Kineococcus sp. TBRC 1896]|uniref:SpoIIE family protein phosphatase n=1 Tax=Kineococcus mangrovi TaxID=1660183 RepID=A0ABV4I1Z8_9ACTN